ncbi:MULTISPECIES: papain-like cysteine protease family protein [Amycolatopsis]|uniref:papain-like cysteine protease family protein n=1 Tax=unclassified Amycolatopsis TaxID=2618356 RepID=UPI0003AA9DB5|nr:MULTISPECIES: papain-like cysteine protease family protein [Amycolatopsis]MCG3756649.1 C39 family peptidase [Amycolatopsis sp. Poz14]
MKVRSSILRAIAAVATAAAAALAVPAAADAGETNISMQAQQKDQWCWDASGNTIAAYWGYSLTQTRFCQIAHNESGSDCANNQGYLSDQQRVFRYLGFRSVGSYNSNGYRLSFSGIKNQIDAGQPIGTRIGWTSGGGHMHVLYGYDDSNGRSIVEYGDPWPSNNRYNSMNYSSYVSNNQFAWTHTVYGMVG